MVDQSELPYRMLGREHGAGLCYSPMIHSRLYAERDEVGRARMFETSPEDRPLVVSGSILKLWISSEGPVLVFFLFCWYCSATRNYHSSCKIITTQLRLLILVLQSLSISLT